MKNEVTAAVRELREALGDTQQQFAHRLGLAISTVVRYELTRPPKGKALVQLQEVAKQHGLDLIAATLRNALSKEMGWATQPHVGFWAGITEHLERNQRLVPGWSSGLVRSLENLIAKGKAGEEVLGPALTREENLAYLEQLLAEARYKTEETAESTIEALARQKAAMAPDLTIEQASARVLEENPGLYDRYNQERADAARGTQFEPGLSTHGTRQHKKGKQ